METTKEEESRFLSVVERIKDEYSCRLPESVSSDSLGRLLRWSRELNLNMEGLLFERAAHAGRQDILRENRSRWDVDTMCGAAEGGHLELIKWLRANGCPWDRYSISIALISSHFEVVKWLRENGCPWNEFGMEHIVLQGEQLLMLKWVRDHE